MSKVRPAQVRFYIDADMLGLAKVLAGLRPDVTYPGDPGGIVHKHERPPCIVTTPAVKDVDWIPQVAARNWLIMTRDGNIQAHRQEIAAVVEHKARMVAFNTEHARSVFDQLQIVMSQCHRIEPLVVEPGPFIYVASRTTLRQVPLG